MSRLIPPEMLPLTSIPATLKLMSQHSNDLLKSDVSELPLNGKLSVFVDASDVGANKSAAPTIAVNTTASRPFIVLLAPPTRFVPETTLVLGSRVT
jgi:hypothetical protein